jgi:GNAT superfamily N-acetyltransferase
MKTMATPGRMRLRDGRHVDLVDWRQAPQEQFLDLLHASLGPAPSRTPEFLRWKHLNNPFGVSPGLVAVSEGELVAARLFMRWQWRRGGRRVEAVRAVDTSTHPDWQRLGLFKRLTEQLVAQASEEGVALVFNTPNARSREGYLKMGWSSVGRVPVMAKVTGSLKSLAGRIVPGAGGEESKAAPSPGRPVGELLAEDWLEAFLGSLAAPGHRLHTGLDSAFLGWRYAAVPTREYRAMWQSQGSRRAAVFLRTGERRGLREIVIAEALATPDERGRRLLEDLIADVVADSSMADYVVASGAGGEWLRSVLRRVGFSPSVRAGPFFTVRPLGDDLADVAKWSAWRLSLGDLELF